MLLTDTSIRLSFLHSRLRSVSVGFGPLTFSFLHTEAVSLKLSTCLPQATKHFGQLGLPFYFILKNKEK